MAYRKIDPKVWGDPWRDDPTPVRLMPQVIKRQPIRRRRRAFAVVASVARWTFGALAGGFFLFFVGWLFVEGVLGIAGRLGIL